MESIADFVGEKVIIQLKMQSKYRIKFFFKFR